MPLLSSTPLIVSGFIFIKRGLRYMGISKTIFQDILMSIPQEKRWETTFFFFKIQSSVTVSGDISVFGKILNVQFYLIFVTVLGKNLQSEHVPS